MSGVRLERISNRSADIAAVARYRMTRGEPDTTASSDEVCECTHQDSNRSRNTIAYTVTTLVLSMIESPETLGFEPSSSLESNHVL